VDENQTIICVVGQIPKDKPGYGFKVLEALKDIPLRMVSYGGSSNNVSVLVNSNLKVQALQALNNSLFNDN
jgi:aspartate kinase